MDNNDKTIVDILALHANEKPVKQAFIFLKDLDGTEESISYSLLDLRAKSIATLLRKIVDPGDRVILCYPQVYSI